MLRSPTFRSFRADLRSLADEDLLELLATGDSRALEVIFDRHSGPAFSLAFRMCGRQTMAEDIVQEAFLSLWRSGARYDPTRGSVRSWVLTAVRNRAIDAFRRESVTASRDVADDEAAARLPALERTDSEVERREDARRIRVALQELPAEQRQVIELAYFGGFTHTEIARMLDLPAGTVKGRMRLGLTKLRLSFPDASSVVVGRQ
ncbi:MAG: sigma-70 family RNA polymerase sigma factor [Actinomycetota bacterium]|nr:sigma-70 family RNA polymerase sigma factor [Actinomycetota bacterium]